MAGRLGPALMVAGGLATVGAVAGGLAFAGGFDQRPNARVTDAPPTVVTIVDGDTLDVARGGQTVRIRLLNVDTPETVDPNRPPECGGAQAAAWLEQRLPPGTPVTLAHDQERLDQYGRELAWVTAPDGGVVNLEIARNGLGEAMVVEPNHAHYSEILAAEAEARAAQAGLFDPAMECTLPAQVTRQVTALQQTSAAATGEADGDLAAALAATAAVYTALDAAPDTVPGRLLGPAVVTRLRGDLERAEAAARARQTQLEKAARAEDARQAAEAEAARRAAEETARREAQAKEDEARRAAEQAQRDAEAAAEEERRRQEANPTDSGVIPAPPADAPPAGDDTGDGTSDAGSSGNDNGYTGPRCYEPGGQVWHPC